MGKPEQPGMQSSGKGDEKSQEVSMGNVVPDTSVKRELGAPFVRDRGR